MTTYRAWRPRAITPAPRGAAAEVPPWELVHWFLPTSVVCCSRHIDRISSILRCESVDNAPQTHDAIPTSRAIRDDQVGSATLRVIGMFAHMIHGSDRHAVYAICVSIKVALITTSRSVPTCEDENAALATSAILD